jgi:polyferredoxin
MATPIHLQPSRTSRWDILAAPGLRRVLLWKHSRTAAQSVFFALAALMVLDGLLGSPLAAKNTATVAAWVHYRGFIILALLLVGNLFCAACPFLLPRTLARWLGRPTRRWPRRLRNKWLALAALLAMLFVYELFDLWASPWLTAWVIVAYFAAAFVLEALFTRDSFCMYLCPLGSFNFLYSTVSPFQITSRSQDVCRTCPGKECINGRYAAPTGAQDGAQDGAPAILLQQGCQLELYVPQIKSNLDCTLCLDCAKACPYDNVALAARPHGAELFRQSWPRRLDLALLAILAAFLGLVNAFAMTPPVYALEQGLARLLRTQSEALVLGIVFVVGAVLAPLALVYAAAWINRRTVRADRGLPLRRAVIRYAPAFVPLGFGVWAAHYLFHLLVGPLTIWPAFQNFWPAVTGVALFGAPDWALAGAWVPRLAVVQAVQMVSVAAGLGMALAVAWRAARTAHPAPRPAWVELAPWAAILLMLAALAVWVFLLPMEMRGNVLG